MPKRLLLCILLSTSLIHAQSERITIAHVEERPVTRVSKLWVASSVALIAATSLDAASSWGQPERNRFLQSSDGTFGAKGLSLKLGLTGAMLVPQFIFRRNPGAQKMFTISNFVQAGMYSGAASRNWAVRAGR